MPINALRNNMRSMAKDVYMQSGRDPGGRKNAFAFDGPIQASDLGQVQSMGTPGSFGGSGEFGNPSAPMQGQSMGMTKPANIPGFGADGGTRADAGGNVFTGQNPPDDPLGGPRGLGTAGDPLFGSNVQSPVDELPGGREDGYQFRTTPGYQFRLNQAQQAVENSAASRGGLLSGNHLKDLTRFSQGLAEDEFRDVFNMLGSVRTGNPTNTMSNAAMNTGTNVGNIMRAGGQAQAVGALNQSQAWQQGFGGAVGSLMPILTGGGGAPPVTTSGIPTTNVPPYSGPGG